MLMIRAAPSAPAPAPPRAAAPVRPSNPASDSRLKFSNGKLASRSCKAARAANPEASTFARSKMVGVACIGISLRAELPCALTMLHPIRATPEYPGAALQVWDRPGAGDRDDQPRCRP